MGKTASLHTSSSWELTFARKAGEADTMEKCYICLDDMDASADDGMSVEITCGHRFHAACLAPHVRAKCMEAIENAEKEPRSREAELGLDAATRDDVLGDAASLVDLS